MKQIAYNRTKRTEKPKYIVIHTTGNPRRGADAEAHFQYWNSGSVGQSADFVVDDSVALQINDYNKYYTHHCGDGKGRYGITNSNSIGIEICINADGDFDKALENTIKLVKELKKQTGITQVVRHYDASRKNCPAELATNNWAGWKKFLEKVNSTDTKEQTNINSKELTTVNDIVWELANRGVITDKMLWLKKLQEDKDSYWLARKAINYIVENV